jgi:hypothetical protein
MNYIDDLSGNGYVLYKNNPATAGGSTPFLLSNQGYLFEPGMFAVGLTPIMLQNYDQFTIDFWVRRESIPSASNTAQNAFTFTLDRVVGGVYYLDFGIYIQDTT